MQDKGNKEIFARVILPLRFDGEISYSVPSEISDKVFTGSFVNVKFAGKSYTAVVDAVETTPPSYKGKILDIESLAGIKPVPVAIVELWRWIADYYMCSIGEVYRAALPPPLVKGKSKRARKASAGEIENEQPNILSDTQKEAESVILDQISKGIPVLLKGVTGSGKTEIYISLAAKMLQNGNNVLYMLPEIALSRQLSHRLEKIFGEKLLVYHSGQTSAERKSVHEKIHEGAGPYIVLGLRSSVFLPFSSLGLVIIDEEHDWSYKQNEPAPRYNGRDTALMLAKLLNAGVVLGSATPSLESIYNTATGRFSLTELKEKFFLDHKPVIEIIDTIREGKRGKMQGIFSSAALESVENCIKNGQQVLIFRNRRSYSPLVQCIYCGEIPKCENCNVSLSYHKSKGVLLCHYCGKGIRFNTICTKCGKPGLKERGSGTEMAEEQIANLMPGVKIARFDAETTQSRSEQKRIIREFSKGEIDIIVGTQMLSKGFDFGNLNLILILNADSMFAAEDFRAGERGMQMLIQLAGRGGRRDTPAKVIIQTAQPEHNIIKMFERGEEDCITELSERKEFGYPPFTRLIRVIVKHRDSKILGVFAERFAGYLKSSDTLGFTGPFPPPVDFVRGEHILHFFVKLPRSKDIQIVKKAMYEKAVELVKREGGGIKLWFDVDPY